MNKKLILIIVLAFIANIEIFSQENENEFFNSFYEKFYSKKFCFAAIVMFKINERENEDNR